MFRGVGGDTLPDLAVKFQEKYIQTLSTADRVSYFPIMEIFVEFLCVYRFRFFVNTFTTSTPK